MKVIIYDPKTKRNLKVGEVLGGTYIRKIRPEHFMYSLRAFGMQDEVLQTLKDVGCKLVHLDRGDTILESHLRDWEFSSIKKDYGHGVQFFLSINKMKEILK